MPKRKRFDLNQPGAQALADSIVHGAAVTEGTMVAFPTCFPGVTVPLPADESHVTAMDVTPEGIVYAGTSGRASHLLVGMFHGITGMVFDMAAVPGADECAAMCCSKASFVAGLNGPAGGMLVVRELQPLPFDLIQEWHVWRRPLHVVEGLEPGERIVHAIANKSRERVVVATDRRLLLLDPESRALRSVAQLSTRPRLARGRSGAVYGRDEKDTLWRLDPSKGRICRAAVRLPKGDWSAPALMWASDSTDGTLYTFDANGRLYSFTEKTGFSKPLATLPLAPVGAMAVTPDGRLFVSAGDGIARLFCLDADARRFRDLGVAVSVMERRRYGYCFGDAVVGRDGEVILGENDNLGHLWLYFPRIVPASKPRPGHARR